MFEWLFPGWTNPHVLALLVGARLLFDAGLTAVVARSLGVRSSATAAAAGASVCSAATTVLVLRGVFGTHAANVELLVQLGLVVLAGVAASRRRATGTLLGFALAAAGALVLGLLAVPLYGEATVAP